MFEIKGKYTTAKVMIDNIEPECMAQIVSMTNNEAFTNPIAIMPDTHSGKGSVIGFTMEVGDKIIPNIVGVDIGCGMLSFCIGKVKLDHVELDKKIREQIPFGMNVREVPAKLATAIVSGPLYKELYNRVGIDEKYALNSIGSLGGGNHFCEIGVDENENTWITIHTGSRNLGKKVCEYWQNIATLKSINKGMSFNDGVKLIKTNFPKSEWNKEIGILRNKMNMTKIRSTGLEYLEGEDKDGYLNDMYMAQNYAKLNRRVIRNVILDILKLISYMLIDEIETVHNFIDPVDNIIRKGAIRSYKGEVCIIPFNPAVGLLFCEGKSNSEWNYSAPHGAGRIMSRSAAKKNITNEMAEKSMGKVFSTNIPIDENPLVYKDPLIIEKCIEPTITILNRVIPIHSMKAADI